jgi:DNA excision repair protein ERCC-2
MKIIIEDLPVIFPYPLVFNEQIEYMTLLKRTLDSTGHALLEMPTGTGKTICLLALLTSYLTHRTKYKKVRIRLKIVNLLH